MFYFSCLSEKDDKILSHPSPSQSVHGFFTLGLLPTHELPMTSSLPMVAELDSSGAYAVAQCYVTMTIAFLSFTSSPCMDIILSNTVTKR